MIRVADEFTSDASRALEKSLRDNQYNSSVRNIVALIINDKCLVSEAKISFNNSFAFNYHTIFHSTKTEIRYRCDGINKITTPG